MKPLLHVAVDALGGDDVIEALKDGLGEKCDIIECGGTNIFAEGVKAITKIKERYPDKEVVADIKIIPVLAKHNGQMFFDAGADSMIVCANESVEDMTNCINFFKKNGKKAYFFVDIPADKIIEDKLLNVLKESGAENIIYHTARVEYPYWRDSDIENVKILINNGFKTSVTGRIKLNTMELFKDMPIYSFIIGTDIINADDPHAKLDSYKSFINNNY